MPIERKLIAPFKSGIETNLKPWQTTEDAVETLENAYVFRGRIKKKPGFSPLGNDRFKSQLKIKLGRTESNGFFTHSLVGHTLKPGQKFQIGKEIFTIPQFGLSDKFVNLLKTGTSVSPVIDLIATQFTVSQAAASTDVFYHPTYQIMGIARREYGQNSVVETLVFDTEYSYRYKTESGWIRFDDKKKFETGSTDFFSFADFYGDSFEETFFYVVNGNPENEISYLEETSYTWKKFKPWLGGDNTEKNYLYTGKIIKVFADRLFVFNTFEGDKDGSNLVNYPFRIRCSPVAKRASTDSVAGDMWKVGEAGSAIIEIPTREKITAVEIIRENLMVFCEKSIWKIVSLAPPTDKDETGEFLLKRVNQDFGAESINSLITLEENIVGLSNLGFFITDSVSVKRIDEKIPKEFERVDRENDGMKKVFSLRDVKNKLIYWGFPENSKFPNKMFCWNYEYDSWAVFDFSFTAMGFFDEFESLTWSDVDSHFSTWANWNMPWNAFEAQKKDLQIIVGNQQGFVFSLNYGTSQHSEELDVESVDISNQEIRIIDHNLKSGDWVYFINQDFPQIEKMSKVIFINDSTIKLDNIKLEGTYAGKTFAKRVPKINIVTKDYMFGANAGKDFQMPYVDFLFSDTTFGEVIIRVKINSGDELKEAEGVQLGSNIIKMRKEGELGEFTQDIRWKRFFLHTYQSSLQFIITLSDEQMKDLAIASSDMELHAMLFYVNLEGRLTT